jgi:hypothetical protein
MKKTSQLLLLSFLLITGCKKSSDEEVAGSAEILDGALVLTEVHLSCEEARLVNYINLYRKSKSLSELTVSVDAIEAARSKAQITKGSDAYCALRNSSADNAKMEDAQFKSMGLGNNFGAEVEDVLAEPLDVYPCTFPTTLPKC